MASSESPAPGLPARTWAVAGAGSILPRTGYGAAGHALRPHPGGGVTLFDCGPGTLRVLARHGVGPGDVERVVVSHFHPDHVLDLFALAFARRNPALEHVPRLELVGPRGLARLLEGAAAGLGGWVRFQDSECVEVEPGPAPRSLELPGLEGRGLELAHVHTRHTETSLAWRVELEGGRSVTYSGDACEVDALAALAAETDLFVAECSFPDEAGVDNHLTPGGCGRLAREAGARRLLLTHFYPSMDPERARERAGAIFSGPIELARDGSLHAVDP